MRLLSALAAMGYGLACLTACSDDDSDSDGSTTDPDATVIHFDSGAGLPDAAMNEPDAAEPSDAAMGTGDASTPTPDAAAPDAAKFDTGAPEDAAPEDAAPDAAAPDAAAPEAGADAAVFGLTVLDLDDVVANPESYEWFDFRPNVNKLILSGAEQTEHIAILWYTVEDGAVGLHYHSMTESVYVIDGSQTDAQGVYPTGTVYFNPPGSGHEITNSSGFFILAYASPPDFANTDLIAEYTPVRINTEDPQLTELYPFDEQMSGVSVYTISLDETGGMTAELIESTSNQPYAYAGNYVLVLDGSCEINGEAYDENTLVVTNTIDAQDYVVAVAGEGTCLAMGVSF